MASIITADSGGVSGSAGIKQSADSSGVLALATGTGTTAVTIDASQNVGIGTSSPTYKLQVNVGDNQLAVFNESGTWTANGGVVLADYYAATTLISGIKISASTATSGYLTFHTGGTTERMRIDSSGNLLVGTTTPLTSGPKLHVSGNIACTAYATRAGGSGSFGGNGFNINWTGSAAQFWVDSTNIGNFTIVSDYRLKQKVETQTTPALERILQLRSITYEFKDYGAVFKADGVAREGFIAHELQAIIPSAVEGEKDAEDQLQSLKLDALCSVMVKAIQEQQALITTLTERITALEAK